MDMNNVLVVGLAGWIIDDGNYEHFTKGDRASFALEVNAPTTLSVVEGASGQGPSLKHMKPTYIEFGAGSHTSLVIGG